MKQKTPQHKLAKLLGVPSSTLSNILHGKRRPSAEMAARLEKRSGIGRLVWLYAGHKQLQKEIKALYGEIRTCPRKKKEVRP